MMACVVVGGVDDPFASFLGVVGGVYGQLL